MTDLRGKTALVTGASRGIGRAVAVRLGELGANVAVNYSRDQAGAGQTVATVQEAGSPAEAFRADVSKPAEIEAMFQQASQRFDGIDIVIANAGIDETGGNILDVTEADYDRMFAVNAKGAFFTLQQAARWVNDAGSIVYIGSGATLHPVAGFGLYASSKLAAAPIVGVLAQEIGGRGITVNAVLPTATDDAGYFATAAHDDPIRAMAANAGVIGARMGSVADIADAVEFFVGGLSRWISGQQLLVSGGGAG